MDAVLAVDDELLAQSVLLFGCVRFDILVYASGAASAKGAFESADVPLDVTLVVAVLDDQVDGLVFSVVGTSPGDRGENVEGELSVGLGVVDGFTLGSGLGLSVVLSRVVESPRYATIEDHGVETRVGKTADEAKRTVEGGSQVADFVELLHDVGVVEFGLVVGEVDGLLGLGLGTFGESLNDTLGSGDTGLHGVVSTLDLGHVEETGSTAEQSTTGEVKLGDGLVSTFIEGPGSVGKALTALEEILEEGVVLHALELPERAEVRVRVVETNNETDRDHVVFHVVAPGSTVGRGIERPTHGVCNETSLVLLGLDTPDLLDTETVGLSIAPTCSRKLSCLIIFCVMDRERLRQRE